MALQLLNGDCLELMATLPDKSIDLFLCDLPYGCLADNRKKQPDIRRADNGKPLPRMNERITGCKWDIPIDLNAFWVQVKRLCKNEHTPVLMFCTAKFGYELIKSNEDWFRYDLVWNKTHKLGAKLFKVTGIISVIGVFFGSLAIWFILMPIVIASITTIVYSYLVYRKL